MSDQEFWDRFVPARVRNSIFFGIAASYIFAVIEIISAISGNGLSALFAAVFIVCGVGLQRFKSKICSIVLIINITCMLIAFIIRMRELTGNYIFIAVIAAVVAIAPLAVYNSYNKENPDEVRKGFSPELLCEAMLLYLIPSVFMYHKIRADYDSGLNEEFFDGRNAACNPYEGEVNLSMDLSGEEPLEQEPSIPEYSLGDAPNYPQPRQDSYAEPWEIEDIKTGK